DHHVVDAFGSAEASLGERQVGRDVEDDGVVEVASDRVEAAYALGADARVDAREDVEHDALAGLVSLGQVRKTRTDEPVARRLGADGRQLADGVDGVALECSSSHGPILAAQWSVAPRCSRRPVKSGRRDAGAAGMPGDFPSGGVEGRPVELFGREGTPDVRTLDLVLDALRELGLVRGGVVLR